LAQYKSKENTASSDGGPVTCCLSVLHSVVQSRSMQWE